MCFGRGGQLELACPCGLRADACAAVPSQLPGLLEKGFQQLSSFLRNPSVQSKISVTQDPRAGVGGRGCSRLPVHRPEGHTYRNGRPAAGTGFPFRGSQGRQLSSSSHGLPDPRRKQRDTDKWPDFFFSFLLGQVSLALNSNFKAKSDSGGGGPGG